MNFSIVWRCQGCSMYYRTASNEFKALSIGSPFLSSMLKNLINLQELVKKYSELLTYKKFEYNLIADRLLDTTYVSIYISSSNVISLLSLMLAIWYTYEHILTVLKITFSFSKGVSSFANLSKALIASFQRASS